MSDQLSLTTQEFDEKIAQNPDYREVTVQELLGVNANNQPMGFPMESLYVSKLPLKTSHSMNKDYGFQDIPHSKELWFRERAKAAISNFRGWRFQLHTT